MNNYMGTMYAKNMLTSYNQLMDLAETSPLSRELIASHIGIFHKNLYVLMNQTEIMYNISNMVKSELPFPLQFHTNVDNVELRLAFARKRARDYIYSIKYTIYHKNWIFYRWVGIEEIMNVVILHCLPDINIDSQNSNIIERGSNAGMCISHKYMDFEYAPYGKDSIGGVLTGKPISFCEEV